jgi:transposase
MANRLKVGVVHSIYVLLERGWSQRRIAGVLGIDRGTVARYARLARDGPKPAGAPPGTDEADHATPGAEVPDHAAPGDAADSNPATAPPGSTFDAQGRESSGGAPGCEPFGADPTADVSAAPRPLHPEPPANQTSKCEPYREVIKAKLDLGLTAKRIHQDLVGEYDFKAKYHSVRRFVQRLGAGCSLPFRRMECEPGEEAQIDFGTGAPIVGADGRRRRTHVFRIVLSHSRKAYSEAVLRQTTDDFIRCIENAFHHFGGVPKTLVIDNLKAAVTKADWFDPDLNPKIRAFAEHHDTVILPTKPRTPRHKGKVERGVDYVQNNALKGRRFSSLNEQNEHLLRWETTVADTRIHGTTRQQVKKAFEDAERAALLPLPVARFASFQEARRKVNRDGHVEVDKAYYSVPPEYLSRRVWARWDSRVVRVFNHRMEQIAFHVKHEPGRFSTQDRHIHQRKRSGVEKGAAYLLNKTSLIGTATSRWAEQMIHQRGVEGVRVLMGLLNLAHRHQSEAIEEACAIASTHGAYRLRTIRELLKRGGNRQGQFEFLQEHPIIRSMADYGELVHTAFGKEQ